MITTIQTTNRRTRKIEDVFATNNQNLLLPAFKPNIKEICLSFQDLITPLSIKNKYIQVIAHMESQSPSYSSSSYSLSLLLDYLFNTLLHLLLCPYGLCLYRDRLVPNSSRPKEKSLCLAVQGEENKWGFTWFLGPNWGHNRGFAIGLLCSGCYYLHCYGHYSTKMLWDFV